MFEISQISGVNWMIYAYLHCFYAKQNLNFKLTTLNFFFKFDLLSLMNWYFLSTPLCTLPFLNNYPSLITLLISDKFTLIRFEWNFKTCKINGVINKPKKITTAFEYILLKISTIASKVIHTSKANTWPN